MRKSQQSLDEGALQFCLLLICLDLFDNIGLKLDLYYQFLYIFFRLNMVSI